MATNGDGWSKQDLEGEGIFQRAWGGSSLVQKFILFVDATWFYNHLQKKRRQPDGIIRYFCSVISETVKIEDGSIFNLLTILHFVAWFEVRETLFVAGGKLSQIL